MLDLLDLKVRIESVTGYITEWAKAKEPSLTDREAEPRVFVMYFGLQPVPEGILGDGDSPDPYNYFAEDLSQKFITQLVCDIESFGGTQGVWMNYSKAVLGWIPYPEEKEFTGIYHCEGGTMGLDNGRIWWQDTWRIDFPRASLLP